MSMQSQAEALRQTQLGVGETARFWREPRYDGLECLTARFRTHVYERHTHETYVIGCIVTGCERFEVGGVHYTARPGHLCFVNPDAAHDGRPEGEGYAYRMIYPTLELIADIARDLIGKAPAGTLTFGAHRVMEQDNSALESDEAMVQLLGRIFIRHRRLASAGKPAGERQAVRRVMDYLAAHVSENVDLVTLSGIAGLFRSHLIRVFKHETGLTPHAFMIDRRVRLARSLLLGGSALAEAAIAAVFADQPHMTRAFKARIGVTPGSYARMT